MALSQYIEIHSLNDEPAAIVKTGYARIIQGQEKLIHFINISAIQETLQEVQDSVRKANISKQELLRLIDDKLNNIKDGILQLKPRRRPKRWDALGRAWKWMSGSPDADDLKLITNGLNDIADNNNIQININEQMLRNLDNLTETINEMTQAKREEEENIMLIIILTLEKILLEVSAIQEAITLAKLGVISYKILTPEEITRIENHVVKYDIHPDVQEEALNLASVTVGADSDLLVYIINLPTFRNETYVELWIETVFRNSLRIQLKGNRYIMHASELYLVKNSCEKFGNWSLCHQSNLEDLSFDRCISMIVKGQQGNCTYEAHTRHPIATEVSPTTIMLNDVNTTIHSTCGIADRFLTGTFIVIYQNCSITIDKYRYVNDIIGVVNQRLFLPSTGLMVTKERVEHKFDIHALHQNLKRLEHIRSTAETHSWSLIGGFSISTTTIACFVIYLMIKLRSQSPTVNISSPNKEQGSTKFATTRNIHYYIPSSTNPARQAV